MGENFANYVFDKGLMYKELIQHTKKTKQLN